MASTLDAASSARHLTGPRRQVLEALDACGPADTGGIADCWRSRRPNDTATSLGDRLPGLISGLLWKLEALDWVEPIDDRYAITYDGAAAMSASGTAARAVGTRTR
jgi:hypothetical protein